MTHFADRLLAAIESKNAPVCVGIDPVYAKLPRAVVGEGDDELDAITEFSCCVIDAVAEHVPCVKVQSACFERYGYQGEAMFGAVVSTAIEAGLLVISDVKRGDIGISAEHYAHATLCEHEMNDEGTAAPDAVTINSYLGADGILPFCATAAENDKGVFALVRTSNPGGDAIQSLELTDGRTVAQAVAEIIASLGSDPKFVGESGYSLLGAVVGATKPGDAAKLRSLMPQQLFLVPGFGAQGGAADDVRACFHTDGRGAIITASRSVIYAFDNPTVRDWQKQIENAAIDFKKQVNAVLH